MTDKSHDGVMIPYHKLLISGAIAYCILPKLLNSPQDVSPKTTRTYSPPLNLAQ